MPIPDSSTPYVLITDENLNVMGDPITQIRSIDGTLNWNTPDSFAFTVPAYPEYMSQLVKGNRAVLIDRGSILTAGPIEKPGGYQRSKEEPEPGLMTVNFADDTARIAGLRVYPNPAQAANAQTVADYSASGNAEVVMRNLVNLNAGPGALVARRIPKLILGALASVGTSVLVKERFTPLGEVLRNVALSGGGIGFKTVQTATDIEFRVFASRDQSKVARFSFDLGNLQSVSFDIEAPTATTVFVGGTGEDTARPIVERTNATAESAWFRVEDFVDAAQNDDGTSPSLEQSGDMALAEKGERVSLSVVVVDTEDVAFGDQYLVGDTVTVETLPGVEVKDKVRAVHYTYTPKDGRRAQAVVGTESATSDRVWLRAVQDMSARLGTLERR